MDKTHKNKKIIKKRDGIHRIFLEAERNQLARNLQLLLDSTDEGIYGINLNGCCTFINKAGANLIGYEPNELLNLNMHEVLHYAYEDGSPYPVAECQIFKAFHMGKGCHVDDEVLWQRDGSSFPAEYSSYPVFDENRKIIGAVVTFRDITWRREIEKKLRLERDKYRELLKEMQATQNQLIATEKMAALGSLVAGIAHEINTPLGAINASASNINTALNEGLQQLPTVMKKISAEQLDVFSALLKNSLEKMNILMTSRDEREYKRALIKRLQKEGIDCADKIGDMFIDMGIYTDIDPFLKLLHDKDNLAILQLAHHFSLLHKNACTITESIKRTAKLIFALRTYTHYEHSSRKTEENIKDSIEIVLILYYNQLKHGVKVVKNYQEIPVIPCYPDELNQVWTNLIQNAIHAMENKGTLTIDVFQENNNVIVKISDTGHGISSVIKNRIFEPFFTTKSRGEGSGLGLSIVKKIIDKHSGKITVESSPGKTVFTVLLPIVTTIDR